DAAEASVGAARHLRRGPGRPRGSLLRHRELYAGAAHPAPDGGAARRGRHRPRQLGGLLPHLLEVLPRHRRVQGREAARGLHPRARPDVHQEAGGRHRRRAGPQDAHRRRHRGSGGQGPRRLRVRQARPRVLRAAQGRGGRRGLLPARVHHLVQARDRDRAGHPVSGRHVQLRLRLLHERGQVEQAAQAGPGRDHQDLGRAHRPFGRPLLGRRGREGPRRAQEVGGQDRERGRRLHRGGPEALRPDRGRLDQEGLGQGGGRGQDPGRVPRRAEEGRRREVSRAEWGRRVEGLLGVASAVILLVMMLLTFVDVVARYLFNRPIAGAFEVTELLLLVLIFAGLPLVTYADEHALMDFIDRLLGPRGTAVLERAVQALCAAVMFLLAWLVWLKADRIWAYRDATDVLRILYGPFVYFMAVAIGLTGVIHLYKIGARR